jgi:flagellar basal body-associated protein FliL
MSLINQALRKAQDQRTTSRVSTAAQQANLAQPTQPSTNSKPSLVIGLITAIVILIGLIAGLTVVMLLTKPAPTEQQAPLQTMLPVAPAVPSSTMEPIRSAVPTLTANQPNEQNSSDVLEELHVARQAAEAKAAAETAARQATEARTMAKPSQEIIEWLGRATISGVRLSPASNKVILNNRAYSVGEFVNSSLAIKILIIQEKRILFVDANGKKYLKQL